MLFQLLIFEILIKLIRYDIFGKLIKNVVTFVQEPIPKNTVTMLRSQSIELCSVQKR